MAFMREREGRARGRALLAKTGHHLGKMGGHFRKSHHPDEREDKSLIDHEIREAFSEHDKNMHGGKHERIHLAAGGSAGGEMGPKRADQSSRGKKGKGATVNIVVAPHTGGPMGGPMGGGAPMPPPHPMPAPPPPMAGPPPGMGPGPQPAMGAPPPRPPMPPPGAPMMRKAGGRAGHDRKQMGGPAMGPSGQPMSPQQMQAIQQMQATGSQPGMGATPPPSGAMAKSGGRTKRAEGGRTPPHMTAGSLSGEGRLEKAAALKNHHG